MIKIQSLKYYIRWMGLSVCIGVVAGMASSLFLSLLYFVTKTREQHLNIIWCLPMAGFAIGWVYHRFGKNIVAGNNLILDEILEPRKMIPFYMAPFILLGTLVTHLFGGSAGREGTAVQMGASLADQLTRFIKINPEERKILLMAGMGAGFGSAIGAPWAGALFGMEVVCLGRLQLRAWYPCLISSFVAYQMAIFLGAPHSVFLLPEISDYDVISLASMVVAGGVFGFAALFFCWTTRWTESTFHRWVSYPPLRPLVGGVMLAALFYLEGSYKYDGLGITIIQEAIGGESDFVTPVFKSLFTSLTVGSGFKGGEFIPLVFVGTTLGSALAALLPVSFSLLAAVGFASVFAAASNTPIACTIMAVEIFGPGIAPYAAIGCGVSYFLSGRNGIYQSQNIQLGKLQIFKDIWNVRNWVAAKFKKI